MNYRDLHDWNVGYTEAVRIQQVLREQIRLEDAIPIYSISLIAGADISYDRDNDRFFAAVVVLRFPELDIVETAGHSATVRFPYIPGLLSFREAPVLLEAFAKLRNQPDIALFDGQGIAHPRGLGLASHMGLFLDLPTIGSAKSRLFGVHGEVAVAAGSFASLMNDDQVIGVALRTKHNVNPVYVSPGHLMTLKTARSVVLASCRGYRVPEPIRQAHLHVNRMRTEAEKQSIS